MLEPTVKDPAPPRTTTVTLMFSDIEGSTRLLQALGPRYTHLIETHHVIVRSTLERWSGREIDNAGDGFFIVFPRARDAVAAAVEIQRGLAVADWPDGTEVRVRMGIHTGEPAMGGAGYVGLDVHRAARICSAASGGQVLVSASTSHLIENDLPGGVRLRDLGRHRLKDLHESEHILQVDINDLPREFPSMGGSRGRLHNCGDPATLLIGREREVAEIRDLLLRDDVRVVTLTGPGGTGKTRLALDVAVRAAEAFDNGAWFVPLASVREPALVGSTIARSLGIAEHGSPTIVGSLVAGLADRQTLLLLDNFEHVGEAAPLIAELLGACPGLEVLATSRGGLHMSGEYEYPVSPLAVPTRANWQDHDSLRDSPAIQLFLERARAVRPDFQLTTENSAAVAEICSRLDGLPLALELAAARTRLFSPQALLGRLGRRLDLLKGGARDLPERHQTLRLTIAWSHDLLTDAERALFRKLSVFIGGCTIEAAESVVGQSGDLGIDVIDGIAALVDRGLMRREEDLDGETRFVMLETIREFGQEQLDPDELAVQLRAHAEYFVGFAENAASAIAGPQMNVWLDRMEADHDNLRGVMSWAEERSERDHGIRLGAALWRFCIIRGHMREGRELLERVFDIPGPRSPSPTLARLLHGLGTLTHELSEPAPARAYLEQALAMWTALGDARGIASATAGIGWVATIVGDFDEADVLSNRALERYRALDDTPGIALCLHQLAWVASRRGAPRESVSISEEVLRIRQRLGDRRAIAFTTTNLAYALIQTGDYVRAAALLDEAFVSLTMLGDRQISAWNMSRQAFLAWTLGQFDLALSFSEESQSLWREVGNVFGLALTLTDNAKVLARVGQHERAADAVREADVLWRKAGSRHGLVLLALAAAACDLDRGDLDAAARRYTASLRDLEAVRNGADTATCFHQLAKIAVAWNRPPEAALFLSAALACQAACGAATPLRERDEVDRIREWIHARTDSSAQPVPDDESAIGLARALARAWEQDGGPGPA